MNNDQYISLMNQCFCFSKLEQEQIRQLHEIGKYESYKEGNLIIKENEYSSRLYLILSGSVQVQREVRSENGINQIDIATLEAGNIVGEISFIDKAPRTASAVALSETLTVSWDENEIKNKIANSDMLIQVLKNNIMIEVTDRFRITNKKYIESLKSQLEIVKQQVEFGRLFLITIILLGINSVLVRLIAEKTPFINPYSLSYSWGYLLTIITLLLIYLRFDISKLKEFGVSLNNLNSSIMHGFVYGIFLVIVLITGLYCYSLINSSYSIAQHINPVKLSGTHLVSYPLNVYLQEFIARGVLLTSLCQFYRDKPLYVPVIIGSLLFGIFHFTFGIIAAVVTFITGIIFSMIYLKDRNLIGVTIAHAIAGWFAFFLGLI